MLGLGGCSPAQVARCITVVTAISTLTLGCGGNDDIPVASTPALTTSASDGLLQSDQLRIEGVADATLSVASPSLELDGVGATTHDCLDSDGQFAEAGASWSGQPIDPADFAAVATRVQEVWAQEGIALEGEPTRLGTELQMFGRDGEFGVTLQLDASRGFVYFGASGPCRYAS